MTQPSRFGLETLQINLAAEAERIAERLRAYLSATRRRGAVVALSGGIDSSVTAALCVRALGKDRVFGLHMPARLFRQDPEGARERALELTLASINSVLAEPIEDCLLGPDTLDVRSPLDIEASVGMPGGHIFHGDLQWPFAESADDVGRWGTETRHPNVFLCGAGARRGGGVSGIPGRAAVAAALGEDALG